MKKVLLSPWTAILTLLVILAVRYTDPGFVESVRLRYFDQLVTSQPSQEIPVSVVNIDEDALEIYGQYPFSRDIYAEIIGELYARGAGLVVFNVLMPEDDRFKQDPELAKLMAELPVVLPSLGYTKDKNTPKAPGASVIGFDPEGTVIEYPGIISSVPIINDQAEGVGIVNTLPEIDGVVRRTPLVILSKGVLYPSLALETLRVAAGDPSFQIKIGEAGVEALRVPKFGKIATDDIGRVWIDWSAEATQYSLAELPKDFEGQIVIVGVSAAGLGNPVATSKGEVFPQDLQASVVGTMILGSTIQRPGYADDLELAVILLLGLGLIFFANWKRK